MEDDGEGLAASSAVVTKKIDIWEGVLSDFGSLVEQKHRAPL